VSASGGRSARIYLMARPRTFPIVLAGFTAFLGLYATQPLLPLLMEVFHATPVAVSLTVTVSTMAVAIAAPGAGRLADSIGRKRVITGSALLLAAAALLASAARDLPWLIFWRLVQGLFTPGVFAVTIAYIHDEWPASATGRAMGAYVSGTVIGGFSGRLLTGTVADLAGWRVAFVVLAAVSAVAAISLAIWLPRESSGTALGNRREPERSQSATGALGQHLRNTQLQTTFAIGFCVLFTQVAMFTYATFLLAAPPFSLSTSALGSLFFVYLLGAIVTPVAGRWIDLQGHRRALAASISIGTAGALLTLVPSVGLIVTGLALCASGVFMAQATASSYIGAAAGHHRGLAVGLYATFYYAGGSLGAALPGIFWESGGWPACVALVVAVQITTIALALSSWKEQGRVETPLPETGA
jgi:YNFM family putative membrane transporter